MKTAAATTPSKPSPPWAVDATAAAVLAALSFAAYHFQIGPAVERHNGHTQRVAELADQKARAADLAVTAVRLRRQLDPAAGAEPVFQLQPASALNTRLAALTDLAVAHMLHLDSVEPGKETSGAGHGTVEIRLAGRGGYRDVAAFIRDARTRIPDTGFTDLTLTAPANPAEPATFTVRLVWHTAGRVTGTAQ